VTVFPGNHGGICKIYAACGKIARGTCQLERYRARKTQKGCGNKKKKEQPISSHCVKKEKKNGHDVGEMILGKNLISAWKRNRLGKTKRKKGRGSISLVKGETPQKRRETGIGKTNNNSYSIVCRGGVPFKWKSGSRE